MPGECCANIRYRRRWPALARFPAAFRRRAVDTSSGPKSVPELPENTVFVRRRPTGEIWTPEFGNSIPAATGY
jgi:hypothetical protein